MPGLAELIKSRRYDFGHKPKALAAVSYSNPVPAGLDRILRPQAAYRWILPQLAAVTPTYIEQVLRGALGGAMLQQWELFDLMEDTWPRLTKDLNEVKRAVQSLEWRLEPWQEEDEAPSTNALERTKLVSSAIWRMQPESSLDEADFEQTIYDILDAWGKGTSVIEVMWHMRQAGQLGDITAPRATSWVHPQNYCWNSAGQLGLNPNALREQQNPQRGGGGTAAYWRDGFQENIEFPPDKFLVAICKARSGSAITSALLRPLAWWWCAANFSADWLMNYAQIFGLPFRWANYVNGAPQATVDAICLMLEKMGTDGWAAFPEGTTLEMKDVGQAGSQRPQGDLMERADKNCDLLVLGQTLTTEQGKIGSMALGNVHEGVREEVIQAAARFVAGVINGQLVKPICRQNYGDEEECPEFRPTARKVEDMKANADRDAVLLGAGVEMPKEWFYKRHEVPLPAEGEEVVGGKAPVIADPAATNLDQPSPEDQGGGPDAPPNGQPKKNGQMAPAKAKATTGSAALDRASLEEFSRALARDFRPIAARLEAILQIQDHQVFADKLAEFVADMDQLKADLLRDPAAAYALEKIITAGLVNGLTQGRKPAKAKAKRQSSALGRRRQ